MELKTTENLEASEGLPTDAERAESLIDNSTSEQLDTFREQSFLHQQEKELNKSVSEVPLETENTNGQAESENTTETVESSVDDVSEATSAATAKLIQGLKAPEASIDLPEKVEITDADYTKAAESKEGLQSLIQKVRDQNMLEIMQKLPVLVEPMVQRMAEINIATSTFWQKNPELKDVPAYVAQMAVEIQSEKPSMGYTELLQKAAEKARNNLGLAKRSVELENQRQESPGFASPPAANMARQQANKTPSDSDRLNDLLNYHDNGYRGTY